MPPMEAPTNVPDGGERLLAKGGLRAGDRLILTKPIGNGVVLAGVMRGKTAGPDLIEVMDMMDVSSAAAARTVAEHGATACADGTGFGPAGRLSEMTRAFGVGALLRLETIPFFSAAVELMWTGIEISLQPNNEQALEDFITEGCGRDGAEFRLRADFWLDVPASATDARVRGLRSSGYARTAMIGTVEDGPLTCGLGNKRPDKHRHSTTPSEYSTYWSSSTLITFFRCIGPGGPPSL